MITTRAIFKKVASDIHGPVYETTAPDGTVWKVERHRWVLPSRWGWAAKAHGKSPVYSDEGGLCFLAVALGFSNVKGWHDQ